MVEIKFLGRGGFGVITSARMLGKIVDGLGYWATALPRFGAERRGAPVHADVRISSEGPIRNKSLIDQADIVIILDPTAFTPNTIISFSKNNGLIILNGPVSDLYNEMIGNREVLFIWRHK